MVEDCHHLLKLRAQNRGITIHEVFEADLPRLWADERALRQICLNLLSNAIKFTPPGGEIWLKVGWTAAGGQYMSVKDTGPGIPEEEIPIVLSSFGQGSNAIKSAEQGAGLGLPIAKSLVDMHGGTFTLKSKVRIGTELIATFPPERVMAALPPLAEPAPPIQPRAAEEPTRRARQALAVPDARLTRFAPSAIAFRAAAPMLGAASRFPIMAAIETPCKKICIVDPGSGLCLGCGRTSTRSRTGSRYSDGERARIMAELPARLEAMRRAARRRAAIVRTYRAPPPALDPADRPRACARRADRAPRRRARSQGWPADDFGALVYHLALIVFLGGAVLVLFRERFSQALEAALFWVVVGCVLAVGYTYRDELRDVGDRVLAELMPGRAAQRGARTVEIVRGRAGDFQVAAQVNGARVAMVLDTGASAVVLTQEAAKAAGLPLEVLAYYGQRRHRQRPHPRRRRSRSTARGRRHRRARGAGADRAARAAARPACSA